MPRTSPTARGTTTSARSAGSPTARAAGSARKRCRVDDRPGGDGGRLGRFFASRPPRLPPAATSRASCSPRREEDRRRSRTLAAAREQLVRRCMAMRGFSGGRRRRPGAVGPRPPRHCALQRAGYETVRAVRPAGAAPSRGAGGSPTVARCWAPLGRRGRCDSPAAPSGRTARAGARRMPWGRSTARRVPAWVSSHSRAAVAGSGGVIDLEQLRLAAQADRIGRGRQTRRSACCRRAPAGRTARPRRPIAAAPSRRPC